jgi:hypothetical protein
LCGIGYAEAVSNAQADGMDMRTARKGRKFDRRDPRAPRLRTAIAPPDDPPDPFELARYIADITAELAALARAARLDLLAYFLNMANAESEANARGGVDREPG